jgi:hypothetical protein
MEWRVSRNLVRPAGFFGGDDQTVAYSEELVGEPESPVDDSIGGIFLLLFLVMPEKSDVWFVISEGIK